MSNSPWPNHICLDEQTLQRGNRSIAFYQYKKIKTMLLCFLMLCYLEYLSRRKKNHIRNRNWRFYIHVVVVSRVIFHYQLAILNTWFVSSARFLRQRIFFIYFFIFSKCKCTTVIDIPVVYKDDIFPFNEHITSTLSTSSSIAILTCHNALYFLRNVTL